MRDFLFIKEGVVYNSANQPIDLTKQVENLKYLYIDKDPLYNLTGRFIKNKVVYPYKSGLNGFMGYIIPSALQAHKLNQFDRIYGGEIPDNIVDKDKYILAKRKADEVYKSHSLYKSAYIQKVYKSLNGRYKGEKPVEKNINRWMDEKWISVIAFLNGDIEQCGSLDNTLTACRPMIKLKGTPITIDEIIKKHGKSRVMELALIKEKYKDNVRIDWEKGKYKLLLK